jgi:hypothetical protein
MLDTQQEHTRESSAVARCNAGSAAAPLSNTKNHKHCYIAITTNFGIRLPCQQHRRRTPCQSSAASSTHYHYHGGAALRRDGSLRMPDLIIRMYCWTLFSNGGKYRRQHRPTRREQSAAGALCRRAPPGGRNTAHVSCVYPRRGYHEVKHATGVTFPAVIQQRATGGKPAASNC